MFSFRSTCLSLGAAVLGTAALFASSANAGLTQTRTAPHNTEAGAAQILSQTYGGSFAASGSGFTNGAITATRVDDSKDNVWIGKVTLTPVASFALSEEKLSLMHGVSGSGSTQSLFDVNQYGYLNAASQTINSSDKFRFVLDAPATTLRASSLATDNLTGDQLVTYKINGIGDGKSHYMLFWEDTPVGTSDRDYNDFVLKATVSGGGGPVAVPLPPSAYVGGATLIGVSLLSFWKRRRAAEALG
jgi:hypothetical protein